MHIYIYTYTEWECTNTFLLLQCLFPTSCPPKNYKNPMFWNALPFQKLSKTEGRRRGAETCGQRGFWQEVARLACFASRSKGPGVTVFVTEIWGAIFAKRSSDWECWKWWKQILHPHFVGRVVSILVPICICERSFSQNCCSLHQIYAHFLLWHANMPMWVSNVELNYIPSWTGSV